MRKKCLAFIFMMITVLSVSGVSAWAGTVENEETGYSVVIEDEADLLTDSEEALLQDDMWLITQYGSAAFITTDENYSTAQRLAENTYYERFGNNSGILFLIDMDNRQLYIAADGAVYRAVTSSKADTITDNVYRMATRGDYYGCASSVFAQALQLLQGNTIAEPMKHICNAILSLIAAMLIFFLVVNRSAKAKAAAEEDLIEGAKSVHVMATQPNVTLVNETRRYSPVVRSSGGGGGGGFSGGGGGGGFSGGGGGHGF